MIDLSRRDFLIGSGALVTAPAVIRLPGLLMPIKPFTQSLAISEELYAIGLDRTYYNASVEPLPNGGVYTLPRPKVPGSLLHVFNAAYNRDPKSRVKIEDVRAGGKYRFAYSVGYSHTFESYDGLGWHSTHSQSDAPRQLASNHSNIVRSF